MKYYSTRDHTMRATLREVVLRGLAPDGGLYMPLEIPRLADEALDAMAEISLVEVAGVVAHTFFKGDLEARVIDEIVGEAINFPAPLRQVRPGVHALELYHGPTCAFKDFGARFASRLMAHFMGGEDRTLHILVATSGDTGSAVASGFYEVPGIKVIVLYPSGKVSPLQEKQLTTPGENITAVEVDGAFDDCQVLVKRAFVDQALNKQLLMSSANSINFARLFPQSFYYFHAVSRLTRDYAAPPVVSVPSGNFGNLTAALIATRMGLKVDRLIAATNANDVFGEFLRTGVYRPRASVPTLSNAMDVGAPSNFERINALLGDSLERISDEVMSSSYSDDATRKAIGDVFRQDCYTLDPHGAVGYLALKAHLDARPSPVPPGVFLETAHPAKFREVVEPQTGQVMMPERLRSCLDLEGRSIKLRNSYELFRELLLTGIDTT